MPYDDNFDSFGEERDEQPLPPDIQVIYQRLLDDGAAWRGDVPAMPSLDERVRMMAQTSWEAASTRQQRTRAGTRPTKPAPAAYHRATRKDSSSPMRTRFGRIAAACAMVAVVALLIGVFAILSHGRTSSRVAGNSSPTTAVSAQWQTIPGLAYSSERSDDTGPAVSPSDPRVVYETNVGREGPAGGQAFFRRTDDAGATWHYLAFPVPVDHVHWITVMVSPFAPHTIIVMVADDTLSDCPASFQVNLSETAGNICELQYLSTDGGATLSLLQTPIGSLENGLAFGVSPLQGQGSSTLYGGVNCPDGSCTRIVRSTDGGHSWSLADGHLHQQAPYVCGFVAAPTGGTLFAVVADQTCLNSYQGALKLTLWRSDDAGNTWARVAALPTPNVYGLLAVNSGNPAQPLLYGLMPKTLSQTPDKAGFPHGNVSDKTSDMYVSADGGHSWTHAPDQGIAAGLAPFHAPLGVLSDGTIIASFIPQGFNAPDGNGDLNGSVLYGWKQGDTSWHQIAQPLTKILSVLTVVPGSNGHDTLWVMEEGFNGQPYAGPDMYTAARFQL